MADLQSETIQLDTPDGPMEAHRVLPSGEPKGGVVVVQEAFGLTGHIRDVTERVAAAGYVAVAPALFHRSEEQVFGYGDFDKLGPVIMQLSGETVAMDVDAALAELERQGQPAARQAIIGFCMGGSVTLATAARLPLGAAVTFYGGGLSEGRFGLPSGLESAARLRTPWLGLYGDLDAHIPVDEVEQVREVVAAGSVPAEVVRYADADHGFHCDERPSFHAESSSDAWARATAFLDEHLG
jgi:carboxymethylenebutenolidase